MPITASAPIRTISRLGFRIDPILAALNLAWGLVGTYIGFFRPSYATSFVLAFAAFYTVLAVFGSFTSHHFGMLLNERVNLFHWVDRGDRLGGRALCAVAQDPSALIGLSASLRRRHLLNERLVLGLDAHDEQLHRLVGLVHAAMDDVGSEDSRPRPP